MYSFFILGEVPGTNITITFTMWSLLALSLVMFAALRFIVRDRQTQRTLDAYQPNSVLHPLFD